MNRMAYCELKSKTDTAVVYAYGATIDDLTGEVNYNFKDGVAEIVKQPEKYGVIKRHLTGILNKHRDDFQNGTFPEKIAYEA